MEPMELFGTEYISKALLRKLNRHGRIYWDDVPSRFRVTEERIRSSRGADDKKWLSKHLTWNGCGRADTHGEDDKGYNLFRPCDRVADISGFCKSHKNSAIRDERVPEGEELR